MAGPDMQTAQAEGWRPEPGDVIVGIVDDIDVGWSDFRGDYPILTIRATDGTKSANVKPGESVKLHCFHDVLYSRIMTLRPIPGETVGVQFHGKEPHKTKPGQTVSRYTFKVAGRTADAAGLYDRMSGGRTPRQPAQQRPTPIPAPATAGDFRPGQDPLPAGNDDDDIPF
jgi:hypothetical protein